MYDALALERIRIERETQRRRLEEAMRFPRAERAGKAAKSGAKAEHRRFTPRWPLTDRVTCG